MNYLIKNATLINEGKSFVSDLLIKNATASYAFDTTEALNEERKNHEEHKKTFKECF